MKKINPDHAQEVRKLINSPGFFPNFLGFSLDAIEIGSSLVTLTVTSHHLQPYGVVHGGVLDALIDTATFWSTYFSIADEKSGLTSVDLKLNYLRPVIAGRLTAKGREIRAGRNLSYAEAYVYDEKGDILVHGTSTIMVLPGKGLPLNSPKFLSGG